MAMHENNTRGAEDRPGLSSTADRAKQSVRDMEDPVRYTADLASAVRTLLADYIGPNASREIQAAVRIASEVEEWALKSVEQYERAFVQVVREGREVGDV